MWLHFCFYIFFFTCICVEKVSWASVLVSRNCRDVASLLGTETESTFLTISPSVCIIAQSCMLFVQYTNARSRTYSWIFLFNFSLDYFRVFTRRWMRWRYLVICVHFKYPNRSSFIVSVVYVYRARFLFHFLCAKWEQWIIKYVIRRQMMMAS